MEASRTADVAGRRVLVTGGAGFVGSHLAETLVAANDVVVLDDLSSGRRGNVPSGATLLEADVRDLTPDQLPDDVELIFHQAGQTSAERSVERPTVSHGVNVEGTLRVLESARRLDARVVVASGRSVYGRPETETMPLRETTPKRPASTYGLEQLAADHYARLYGDQYGLETVVLRYFDVYGPRGSGPDDVVGGFVERALAGDPIAIDGDGTRARDFVHVTDVVRANLLAATTEHVGEAFNVGTGTATPVRELAETVRDLAGSNSKIVRVGQGRATDPGEGDAEWVRADTTRATERLGFTAGTDLRTGLETLLSS